MKIQMMLLREAPYGNSRTRVCNFDARLHSSRCQFPGKQGWGSELSPWYRLQNANGCGNRVSARVVSALEGIEHRIGQNRLGPSNSAKLYHAFFIGDRRHGIDHFVGRLLSQEFD